MRTPFLCFIAAIFFSTNICGQTPCATIQPASQIPAYLSQPRTLTGSGTCEPVNNNGIVFQYRWEYYWVASYDPDAITIIDWNTVVWTVVPGATAKDYTPPTTFPGYGTMYYRRVTTITSTNPPASTVITSNRVSVEYAWLRPGSICIAQICQPTHPNNQLPPQIFQIPFNTLPDIINLLNPYGGECISYEYYWEMSVDNGSWVNIGPGLNFPGLPQGLRATSRFRRMVVCNPPSGPQSQLSSNIVTITVGSYTSAFTENLNYIRENTILIPGQKTWPDADLLPVGDKMQSTVYLDGLGRKMQAVAREVSMPSSTNAKADVVQHIEYDGAGQSLKSFLPYTTATTVGFYKTNASTEQPIFIRNKYSDPTANTWATTTLEQSPIARPLSTQMAGSEWTGHNIRNAYSYNAANEVHIWKVGYTIASTDYPTTTTYYDAGKLSKLVSVDDKGKKVIVFADYSGKTILKKVQVADGANEQDFAGWLYTYNVYDDYGRIKFVIPPKAYKYLHDQNNYSLAATPAIAEELCYFYQYDARGRNTIKHVPTAGNTYMVYDWQDRMVLSQDANQLGRGEWTYLLYDDLDRVIAAGLISGISNYGDPLSIMQGNVQSLNNGSNNVSLPIGITGSETILAYNPVIGTTTSLANSNNPANILVNTISYYDGYGANAKPFQGSIGFPTTTAPFVQSFTKTERILGLSTSSKVRILDQDGVNNNDVFITNTQYYNEDGATIQTSGDNIKGGVDVQSMQYDWSGKVLATHEVHNIPNTAYNNFVITNKYSFDGLHRNTGLTKNIAGADKQIYKLIYNEMGQVAKKILAPEFDDPNNPNSSPASPYGIEQLNYSYNMHGWLTGINKDFALQTNTSLNQWETSFGMYLGYDNRDGRFSNSRLDGKLTGTIWRTQGDNVVRKFDYEYDNLGQFTKADFNQREKPTDPNWSKSVMDFSVSGISYDENGNLLSMVRRGVRFAEKSGTTGVLIDNLKYGYYQLGMTNPGVFTGNRLANVFDDHPDLDVYANGSMGDFKDASYNVNIYDYAYDANGNIRRDANKSGSPFMYSYNFLNKASRIVLTKTSTVINYTYTATGEKLAKRNYSNITATGKNIWYMGDMVFEENFAGQTGTGTLALQYISLEEGRLRIIDHKTAATHPNPTEEISGGIPMPDGRFGVYDYFIKDQQGNTRMVLTEEKHRRFDYCSMEDASSSYENNEFGNNTTIGNSEVIKTRADKPVDWTTNGSLKVSKLGGPGNIEKLGPNKLIKVMAGDRLDMVVDYYVRPNPNVTQGPGIASNIAGLIASLVSGNTGTTGGSHANGGSISATGTNNTSAFIDRLFTIDQPVNTLSNMPKAYLTWLFFDENFNLVSYEQLGSYSMQITTSGGAQLVATAKRVPKNGYAFIYVSNESDYEYVYFDNLSINHTRAKILEETHYYPYGLKIQPISAQAFQKPMAKEKYQGEYSSFEDETGLNEFDLRNYDPVIGRWTGIDPYDQFASGYVGMGNDPINNTDPTGGFLDELPMVFCRAAVRTGVSIKPMVEALLSFIPLERIIPGNYYSNAAGHQFSTFKNLGLSTNYLGEDWTYDYTTMQQPSNPNLSSYSSYEPGFTQRWSRNTSFIGSLTYGIVNKGWITIQNLGIKQLKGKTYASNLGWNDQVMGEHNVEAFAATALNFIPGAAAEAKASEAFSAGLNATRGVTSLVQANRTAGNIFRDQLVESLTAEGREVTIEVFKRTPWGSRFLDLEVKLPGKLLGGIETKLGGSRYKTLQRLKDSYLANFGEWDGSAANLFNRNGMSTPYPVNLVRGPF